MVCWVHGHLSSRRNARRRCQSLNARTMRRSQEGWRFIPSLWAYVIITKWTPAESNRRRTGTGLQSCRPESNRDDSTGESCSCPQYIVVETGVKWCSLLHSEHIGAVRNGVEPRSQIARSQVHTQNQGDRQDTCPEVSQAKSTARRSSPHHTVWKPNHRRRRSGGPARSGEVRRGPALARN